jgi:hypothetical protein
MHDDLRKALAALQEYVSTHANPVRNGPRDTQRDISKQAEK